MADVRLHDTGALLHDTEHSASFLKAPFQIDRQPPAWLLRAHNGRPEYRSRYSKADIPHGIARYRSRLH